MDKNTVILCKQLEVQLDLIEEAIQDYRAGKLSSYAALTAISIITSCGNEIDEDMRRWAIKVFEEEKKNKNKPLHS